jgi:lipid-A-disaccharide synthase
MAESKNREKSSLPTDHRPPTTDHCSLMIIAGEASGDRHGAALALALKRLYPETRFEFFGAGGEEMRDAGVETLVDARDVAIIGIPEIIRAIGKLYSAFRRLLASARKRRPDAVVLIDWPDFNMRLARKLRREGLKVIYYISPQVWAWRRYRVRALRRDVDRMLVILPFEEEFYKGEGIEVEYVGHPLVESARASATREEFLSKHGLDSERAVIALLPGSRKKEIHYHLPAMIEAAARLKESSAASGLQFVVPLASTVERSQVEAIIGDAEVKIIERDTYNALAAAEVAVVASGTATVESALTGTPMVIIYRGSELNWRLIRPLIHLDTFGMVNLIAGRRIAPELMQRDATGEKIAREVEAIMSDRGRLEQMREDLRQVRQRLSAREGPGAEHAARAVMRALGVSYPRAFE